MKKICVVTGTRAEYGLLKPLINKINLDETIQLQLVVTGSHLSPEFGMTYMEIENDNYHIDEKIEILLSSDTQIGISKAMGLALISFSEAFVRLQPDMVVVLGDRFEIFAVAAAATIAKIPIAHIHGGEATEGAFDEAFRHSITKMSYLHFTSTEAYKDRVIQLGENPSKVFNVGAIGIESICSLKLLSKDELEAAINFKLTNKAAVVTFHPVSLENTTTESQFQNLLDALDCFEDMKIIFTKANADANGRIINSMIDDYVAIHKHKSVAFASMGQLKYLSALNSATIVIGNSSSGIIEAPYFRIPTVNIGDRQKGRIQASTTINCTADKRDIIQAIQKGLSEEYNNESHAAESPYGNGQVSDKIINMIKAHFKKGIDLKKQFYDINFNYKHNKG